jgi:predicted nucleic acid-binding protein
LTLVLDASAALAWLIHRVDPTEAALAKQVFGAVQASAAQVPALWYGEVANTLFVFERAKRLRIADSDAFLAGLSHLQITQDGLPGLTLQARILDLGRKHNLSAYDSTYLELAIRRSATLTTFDRKLAEAARSASVKIFGDPV